MSASNWVQRIRHNKEISDRKRYWENVLPDTKLASVEVEPGVLGLHIETFQLREGTEFEGVRARLQQIEKKIDTDKACVCPVNRVADSCEAGEDRIGTEGFRIVWSKSSEIPSIFSDDLTQRERDFIARLEIVPLLESFKRIGYCPLLHARLVTDDDSSGKVIVISVISRSGAQMEDFEEAQNLLAQKYGAGLVAFFNEGEFDSSMMVSIVISAKENSAQEGDISFIETGTIPVVKGIRSAQKIVTKEI
jgi:hypothetical protein